MSFGQLEARRAERGPKVFAQEYLCSPVYTEDAWLEESDVRAAVNPELENYSALKKGLRFKGNITAGFDIGKKRHPSHLAVFETHEGKSVQIASRWMDGWDYTNGTGEFDPNHPTQFEYLLEAKKAFRIDRLLNDRTRGEFDAIKDAGRMPPEFEGVIFTKKRMVAMASTKSDRFTQGTIELIDVPRQSNQLLAVNYNLQAIESPQGHGDSFWSVALAVPEKEEELEFGMWVA